MPDVGVLGNGGQRTLGTRAADEDWELAHWRWDQCGEPVLDTDQALVEQIETGAEGAEVVTVSGVVLFVPAGAEAEDDAAPADVVDGARHVGEQVRIAIADAGDE